MTTVKIFSAPWCAGCKVVKQTLDNANIKYREINIDTDEGMQKAKELGIKNIPVTYVHKLIGNLSDEKKFIGSKPETIKEILEVIGD